MTDAPHPVWRREGLLVSVESGHAWWASHAQCPTVLPLSDRLWRIYFAARDRGNAAHIVAVDVDPGANMRVVARHLEPLLALGPVGAFDHEGMGPSSVLAIDGRIHLFYTGVAVRRDVRFQTAVGVAASADGLRFEKMFDGPVRSTGPFDPYFVSTPSVVRTAAGFRMWYVGGVAWRPIERTPEPFYDIKTVHSADGLAWSERPAIAVALNEPAEAGLGRPHALTCHHGPWLWYSSRSGKGSYRLASVALDPDGISIGAGAPVLFSNPPVAGDFDDAMQCYACVVPYGDDLVMVYNGNDFGRFGFGWARAAGARRAEGSHAAG